MPGYTQENRLIQVVTPLGPDVLLLQGFEGQEGISRPFEFELRMMSENRSISFESVVGKKATIKVQLQDRLPRFINGIVSSFSQGGASQNFAYYHMTIVPWFWLLTRTSDVRIFQNLTVPEIIEKVFGEHGFSDFKNKLHGSFPKREYCVQYRETTFNFISRLMQEEGIFYFFEHEADKHTLVFSNNPSEFKPCPNQATARFDAARNAGFEEEVVTEWSTEQEVRPGRYAIQDFNFEMPTLDLFSEVAGKDTRKYEMYDYPGEYLNKGEGERLVGMRQEEEDAPQIVVTGSSICRALCSGFRFDLKDHYRRDFNKPYVLVSVYHSAEQGTNFLSSDGDDTSFEYGNQFQCIPYPSPFRPPRTAPVPVVHGTQTAIVVGPPGEEIYVDKYGRVKVQFHWDRDGKYDEKSSCWIRVAQDWAGKGWGSMFIPRIGQEVIVDFLEGDPDKPLITGRVYNGASMPPYSLPAEKTKSTFKTYSTKGGGGFNELRFEDKKGSEQIFIHAEKDQDIRIKNELREFVGATSNHTVEKSYHIKVGTDEHLTVGGDHNQSVGGAYSLAVTHEHQETVGSRYALDAKQEIHLKAGTNVVVESGSTMTLKVGENFININPSGIYIKGAMVYINSGGQAGIGAGAKPAGPAAPKPADNAIPGDMAENPPPKKPRVPETYSPGALAMKDAARNGTPFVQICPYA